jgi:DNA-binding MarR family transcriptional regulator
MNKSKSIPLDEKFRILFRIYNDIVQRKNFLRSTTLDLTKNQFIILKILTTTGPLSLGEISDLLNISKAATSKNIDYLVKKRLISRKIDSKNRRKVDLSILTKGNDIIDRYNKYCEKKIKTVVSHYSSKEQAVFNKMIDKFIYYCISDEEDLALFCLQCGDKYEGNCPVGKIKQKCYFHLGEKINNN